MSKEFIGTCIENPFDNTGDLVAVVENYAIEIEKQEFLGACCVRPEIVEEMAEFPYDFEFYISKEHLRGKAIYFYCHSAIEYFYA